MAPAFTWDEYVDQRNNQDSLLRGEFGKIHNRMDSFSTEMAVLKEDVAVLKEDVAVLKEDVAVLKEDGAELKVNFARVEGRMYNNSIHNPFLRVAPIPVYRPKIGITLPTEFPTTAYEFWRLKSPNRKQLAHLVYLAKFYDIEGYEHWEQADAESGSEDILGDKESSSSSYTLEDAVKKYPHMAVEVLASLIGLDEDHFTNFRRRTAELRERPQQQASKRIVATSPEEAKRQKKDLPTLPPQAPKSLPSAILRKKDFPPSERSWKSSHSEPSAQPQLGYDLGPNAQDYLGSPTEAFSDNRLASKRSLASHSKSPVFSKDSDVRS